MTTECFETWPRCETEDEGWRLNWRREMASEKVQTFTDGNFDDATKSGVVLVDFWAVWCGPCRRLAPTVDQLADDFDGRAVIGKLDVDENPTPCCISSLRSSVEFTRFPLWASANGP